MTDRVAQAKSHTTPSDDLERGVSSAAGISAHDAGALAIVVALGSDHETEQQREGPNGVDPEPAAMSASADLLVIARASGTLQVLLGILESPRAETLRDLAKLRNVAADYKAKFDELLADGLRRGQ